MQLYHIPKAIMNRHKPPDPFRAFVLDVANDLSRRRYGVDAMLLPVAKRELIIETLGDLLKELDDTTEWAS
jgi:hypothetical protein